jgi:iron(III) transport system permease protein
MTVAPDTTTPRAAGAPGAPGPSAGRSGDLRRWWAARSASERVVRLLWALGIVVLLGYPLAMLGVTSLRGQDGGFTLENYAALSDPSLIRATLNSIWVGVGTVVGSLVVGIPLAWLVARTDMPGRRFVRTVTVLTFATPSFIAALGWILLLGPRAGMINTTLMDWFGLSEPPFDIFTPWGIIFVLSMFLYPLVFLPTASAFDNIDPQLEQAASGLGASRARVLRTVTLPLVTPSILGGSMLVFVTAFVIFGPVAILGGPVNFDTIPTAMLKLVAYPPRIETAAVVSVPVLAVIVVLLILQRKILGGRRFTTVGGKHGPRTLVRLGRWRPVALLFVAGVIVFSLVLPFGVLLLTSFRRALGLPLGPDNFTLSDNYQRVFDQPQITQAFTNSGVLAFAAVAFGIVFAFLAAWLVQRHRNRANAVVPASMLAPLAFPGAVIGIALIIGFARQPFGLGGGLLILLLAYASKVLPLSYAYISAGMTQIGPEPEEASRSLGAGWLTTWRRISLPLIRPTILAVALLNFVLVFRELETSIFLYTGANPTTATVLYQLASESLYQLMGALSVVIIAINLVIVLVATRWLGTDNTPSA